MNSNRLLSILFVCSLFFLFGCSSDDKYPKTVNIKYEITTSNNPEGEVTTTINNASETEEVENFPYSRAYTQQEVMEGTYLKLTLEDMSDCATVGDPTEPITINCDFTAELSIFVDNEVVKTGSFDFTSDIGSAFVEYTFE